MFKVFSVISLLFVTSLASAKYVEVTNTLEKVDVLILMDNSGSMTPYRQSVVDSIEGLLKNELSLDTRIAVITTDKASAGLFVYDEGFAYITGSLVPALPEIEKVKANLAAKQTRLKCF